MRNPVGLFYLWGVYVSLSKTNFNNFSMISKIEVALRVRLVEALLVHGDALILQDSSIFKEKKMYWQNMSAIASEIARSNDVFIKHNFDNYEGEVPVWAVVEVLSFGENLWQFDEIGGKERRS